MDEKSNASEKGSGEFYVVGIGASAGGLEALEVFFKNMPDGSGMAFVVIQHLSPDYKSLMVELLSKYAKMPVCHAEDGIEISPNNIYLLPRKTNMTIFHNKLYLIEQEYSHNYTLNLPIDIFFRSLAEDKRDKAIAVVLSGTGSDGTRGIRLVKEHGGMVIVQTAENAKFDGMPNSAIATRLADYILPAHEIPGELMKFVKHPYSTKDSLSQVQINNHDDAMGKILSLVRNMAGVDFTFYKPNTIIRRIERRMGVNQIDDLSEYAKYVAQSSGEAETLYKEFLIGVTKFFRDTDTYEIIEEKVVPKLFENTKKKNTIRVWIAGCSTGEEAYSIAMLLREYMENNGEKRDVKIFATDIDKEAIEIAGAGVYPESIAADVAVERLGKWFMKTNDGYQIRREIREMVVFASHNLAKNSPFSKIDLVSCRNLLIYLKAELQKKIFTIFNFSLERDGFLILGSSESIGEMSSYFSSFDTKHKIYKSTGMEKSSLSAMFSAGDMKQHAAIPSQKKDSDYVPQNHSGALSRFYDVLFENYVPPCVFVNEQNKIVHVVGDINLFVRIQPGRLDFDILQMVRKELSIVLGTAMNKARRHGEEVVYRNVNIPDGKEIHKVNLMIKPIASSQSNERVVLVAFEEKSMVELDEESIEIVDIDDKVKQRIKDLEQELQYTKENLQATIEELETSNEELQATNEELIASNEELQSTNEELQSVNEELMTVNSEHQEKIQELMDLNNDMENLLSSTDMGVIFLDKDFRIRKFTPAVTREFNLLSLDLGRKITDISHKIKYKDFIKDAQGVLKSLRSIELEVENETNERYLMKILPYRTTENVIKGVVITLMNIENIKKREESINQLITADDKSPNLIVTTDTKGIITYVNEKYVETMGFAYDEVIGKKASFIPSSAGEGNEAATEIYNDLKLGRVWDGELEAQRKDGNSFVERASIIPTKDSNGTVNSYVKISEDITHERQMQNALGEEQRRFKSVMEASPVAITIVDKDGRIVFANNRAAALFETTKEEVEARAFNDPKWEITDSEGNPLKEEDIPFNIIAREKKEVDGMKHSIKYQNGDVLNLVINGSPVLDENGEIQEVVFAIKKDSDCSKN